MKTVLLSEEFSKIEEAEELEEDLNSPDIKTYRTAKEMLDDILVGDN